MPPADGLGAGIGGGAFPAILGGNGGAVLGVTDGRGGGFLGKGGGEADGTARWVIFVSLGGGLMLFADKPSEFPEGVDSGILT